MTALAPRSFPVLVALPRPCADSAPALRKVFPAALLDKVWAGLPVPPSDYRDQFPRRWSRFLRAVFRAPEDVAVALQIDERTARNHWEGLHRPTGDRVAMLACTFPDEFRRFCGSVTIDEIDGGAA